MKKFFTVIPLQVPGNLEQYHYEPVGNTRLEMEDKTSFPILTAIHGYVQPGEPFQVIAVVADSEVGRANCQALRQELEALCGKYGLTCAGVVAVTIPSDESVSAHAATFQKLIPYAEDEDELFACITFGTKPLSMAVRMAVQYAYRVKRNTSISCIVYGQIDRPSREPSTWRAYVYDETALVRLDEIVRVLADRGVADPGTVIQRILSLYGGGTYGTQDPGSPFEPSGGSVGPSEARG